MKRKSTLSRSTTETEISLSLNIDGSGIAKINTGVGFFDHMLTLFTKHGKFDLTIDAHGDEADNHHIVEGIFKSLGRTLKDACTIEAGNTEIPSSKGIIE